MPAQSIIERSFSGGEISPALYARTDHVKYSTGLRTARNFICMRHGGVSQRPGTMFVASTLNGGNAVRLIPFIFNETGTGQSYVLEFGNQYIAFYQNGGVVVTGGVPYTIVSPYLQADLATLKFSETADVLTIVHPNYPPAELVRNAPTNWAISNISFALPSGPANVVAVPGAGGGRVMGYFVTAITGNGEETSYSASNTLNAVAVPTSAAPNVITWNALTGATSYRVYAFIDSAASIGFVGIVFSTTFSDTGKTIDYSQAPPAGPNPFSSPGNYPSCVGYVQQRRAFGATTNNPVGVWMSQPGAFSNLGFSTPGKDSDTVQFSIAGEEVNMVQHLIELKSFLLLTSGAEIFVQGSGSGVVTPTSINASVQSQYGASGLRPIKAGDVLIFNQALGSFIRDLSFDFVIDGYRGNDLTVFSSHLFEGHQIVDWAFQKIPDSILWVVRDDGILLSLTYVREQQILAWARHDFTNGFVENVVSIPENGNYSVYMVVRRSINGTSVRYIERLSSRLWRDTLTASYLDCYASYDGRNISATTMTLSASGGFQSGTGTEYQQSLTLTSSTPYFGAGQTALIGDEICIQDALFVSSQGLQGNQLRCTIQAVPSSTVATVTPNRAVPIAFQTTPTTNWTRAVKTLSGLTYLKGQSVSVWADRFVVASPLNKTVSKGQSIVVPLSGVITLDQCYSVIYVGLPMTADFETLDIDTSFGESILDQPKNISRVVVSVYNTRGFMGGTENPDTDPDNIVNGVVQDSLYNLFENKAQETRLTYDAPPALITDSAFTNINCNWSKGGRIFIRNVDPIPLSILAVIPAGLTAAKMPYAQKV